MHKPNTVKDFSAVVTGLLLAEENPVIVSLYGGLLKGKVHELLHVDYTADK